MQCAPLFASRFLFISMCIGRCGSVRKNRSGDIYGLIFYRTTHDLFWFQGFKSTYSDRSLEFFVEIKRKKGSTWEMILDKVLSRKLVLCMFPCTKYDTSWRDNITCPYVRIMSMVEPIVERMVEQCAWSIEPMVKQCVHRSLCMARAMLETGSLLTRHAIRDLLHLLSDTK